MGPTASGKTALAEALADSLDAELLNADAFQVYRGLNIGTAKPVERGRYHLVDILEPTEPFGLGAFISKAMVVLSDAFRAKRSVVVVGGSGLYIRGLFEEYASVGAKPDPSVRRFYEDVERHQGLEALVKLLTERSLADAERTDLRNPLRVRRALERLDSAPAEAHRLPAFVKHKVAVSPEPEVLDRRIKQRVLAMLEQGWIEEVQMLMLRGIPLDAPGMRAIGYREIATRLIEGTPLEGLEEELALRTRQYAKRQRTWLRSEPNLHFLRSEDCEAQRKEAVFLL
ncbi:MAG TPA: tRNA (adenosine(37)-N6)-dimethylallyltransferase MiaA [Fimbriimonadaceae bacterium]|nr:tRNA (adenosine(37)-N6)-dimethylallyltransferase MiaA [Fimbriimonadaceae bacterium]